VPLKLPEMPEKSYATNAREVVVLRAMKVVIVMLSKVSYAEKMTDELCNTIHNRGKAQ
jgi:hypothetical protein